MKQNKTSKVQLKQNFDYPSNTNKQRKGGKKTKSKEKPESLSLTLKDKNSDSSMQPMLNSNAPFALNQCR